MNTPRLSRLRSPLPLVAEASEPGTGVSPQAKHTSSRRSPAKLAALLGLTALGVGSAAAPAFGQAILENYGRTLTAYSADSETTVGKVWPLDLNRGVHVDGAMRMGSAQPWAFAGNPFGEGWDGNNRLGDIRLDAGSFNPTDVDLSLPSPGFRWVVGRSFNGRQFDGGSFITSNGPQGKNWMQLSQPEIVQGSGSTGADDVIYIVYGADRYLEFQRTSSTSDIYKGKNGAAGLIKHTAGAVNNVLDPNDDVCELYEYYDQNGTVTTFFGSVGCLANAWQIWKITDPAGNIAYIGDSSNALTARSSGYGSGGRILLAYDAANRRYTYTYTTISGTSRLTQVKAETKSSGTWASPSGVATVGQVDYTYYTADSTDIGLTGDLKMVTITTPLTDSGVNLVQKKHYRYYTRAWADSNGRRGDEHQIKMVLGFEGARNYDWTVDSTLDDDFLTVAAADEGNLKPYAEAYLEYITASDTDHPLKVNKVFTLGQCGCSGGSGTGTYSLSYAKSSTHDTDRADTSYDTAWAMRTVIGQPDGTYFTQYFDETGQPLSRVLTDAVPTSYTKLWATYVARNADGQVTAIHSPAQIGTGYTHDSGGSPSGTFTTSGGSGLITTFNRVSSGDLAGLPEAFLHKDGNAGTAYFDTWTQYTSRTLSVSGATGSGTVVRPFTERHRAYHTETSTYSTANTYDETIVLDTGTAAWWSGTNTNVLSLAPKKLVTSHPVVSTGKNGSNAATTTERFIRTDGTTAFTKNQEGIYSYSKFTKGQVVMSIEDVKTNDATDIDVGNDDPNGVFGITETGDGFHRKTTYAYDAQGRSDTTTMPDGDVAKNYFSKVGDGRMVSISLPPYSSSTTVWYGPASYTVTNHAGKPELSCTLAIAGGGINTATGGKALTDWVTEATADPLDALFADLNGGSRANVHRLSTTIYDKPGTRVSESRSYFEVPTSGFGSAGTNYDATTVVYDDQGRTIRTVDATGTISRTSYDTPGRVYRRYIGTDDTGDAGSTLSGTNNMVKVEEMEYDSGSDHGNSHLTTRTAFVEDSTTGQRITTFIHDYRGRTIVTTNPLAPHSVATYDNRGRITSSAQYTSTSGFTSSTTTSTTTGRIALSETKYDERGQVYQSVRHKIDQADGRDDDSLTTDSWFDPVGRQIKVRGEQYAKTRYDRLGRTTHQYTLANDDDSNTYSNIYSSGTTSVAGDTVMDESITWYDTATNTATVQASLMRHPTDSSTTGDLDTNADGNDAKFTAGNIKGRIQINAMWYDDLDRTTSSVAYGTNLIVGDSAADVPHDFTRAGSPPTASPTELRTDTAYDTAGNVQDVTDPRTKVARTVYDDAGRRIASIANYVNGTPNNTGNNDDDIYTRYAYTSGMQTAMWVDIGGDDTNGKPPIGGDAQSPADDADQVTQYVYGVTKGASAGDSKVSSNRLLAQVIYPPQTGGQSTGDRDVLYAYNAQGQEIYRIDQAGNIFEKVYDTLGRITDDRFTTINTGSGFDDTVKRISTAYLSRGLTNTVTQYDNATVGSGTAIDQVQYTYDDWGNLTKFEQDPDSTIGGSGRAAYSVQYTLSKSAPSAGRQTIRRATQVLPGSLTLTYDYGTANGTNDRLSRVETIKNGGTTWTTYDYTGSGWLVGTTLNEPTVFSKLFDPGTLGSFPNADEFNRTTKSRWTKDFTTPTTDVDIYSVDISYDANANITGTVDNIHRAGAGTSANRAFDVKYDLDGLNRVTGADEGTLSGGGGGSISNRTRKEIWTLEQTGNFDENKVDYNGDLDYSDAGEINDNRDHNNVNEVLTWAPTGVTKTVVHDKTGNMTDDGKDYKFVYDVRGRLKKIKNQSNALVAEYTYNGLGYRIGWHYDSTRSGGGAPNGVVDGNDPWFYFAYDERWRIVATYRSTDSDPKERMVYHAAGLGGYGSSSYIDSVVLRERDNSSAFSIASDGVLEDRAYYGQNWRQDISVVMECTGMVREWVKYSSYGTPFGIPYGDTDSAGSTDSTDEANVAGWTGAYDVRADIVFDGVIDATDALLSFAGNAMGWKALSSSTSQNRKGYAGYENGFDIGRFNHVRHRVLDTILGRWTRRDPIGYVNGSSLSGYVSQKPLAKEDPTGLISKDPRIIPQPSAPPPEQPVPNRPQPPGGTQNPNCGKSLKERCKANSQWEHWISWLEASYASCPVMINCCTGAAGGCDNPNQCGKTKPAPAPRQPISICICTDNCTDGDQCAILVHEMYHAWQFCSADNGVPRDLPPDLPITRNSEYLCREIGAYYNTPGPCYGLSQNDFCSCFCTGRYPNDGIGRSMCNAACSQLYPTCTSFAPPRTPTPDVPTPPTDPCAGMTCNSDPRF